MTPNPITQGVRRHALWSLSALCTAVLVAGCGGGGGETPATVASTVQFSGSVVDGPIEGARVFLDLNGNLAHDAGEPISPPTNAQGAFVLVADRLTQAQAATALLVSHVPDTARDADDRGLDLRAAGRRGFTVMTPVSAYLQVSADGSNTAAAPLLSPLTTLVVAEMAFTGLSLADAKASVQQRLALRGKDPMLDFVAAQDSALGQLARAVAITMGDAGKSIADAARSDGGQTVREHVAATIGDLKQRLPAVLDVVGASAAPAVATILAAQPARSTDSSRAATAQTLQRYVVVFKEAPGNAVSRTQELMRGRVGEVGFIYSHAVQGFAVTLPDTAAEAFLQAMENNPLVDRVEVDKPITLSQTTQTNATWGLDRSDQRDLPLSGSYSYSDSGSAVRAYVVDTGILAAHVDFGGRVSGGYTAISDGYGTSDCNGHGTHVAGTIGAATWGIAKAASLVPVRVLDCAGSGSLSTVLAGLDWVAANAVKPAVVNMSLGGGASSTLDSAVAKVVASGISVVVAAGNDNANACNYSPAREPSAITVGATVSTDARSSYSNFGTCLDLFAPGSSIKSTWYTSTTATNTISGTSMAAPHVAGWAAQILQSTPLATPTQVADAIKAAATTGKVTSAGTGSPNLLIFIGPTTSTDEPPPASTAVAVSALTGSGSLVRNGWRATAGITVTDANGVAVGGAVVTGSFTVGGTGLKCTTSVSGVCSITSGNLSKRTADTTFSVTGITGTNMTYDSANNLVSSVTIRRP
ncbi:MAG: S8 family peptidase [Burkholderiaceae bacterium]|nr:S8 family peptidase [Burkholderiaceae bacterium]